MSNHNPLLVDHSSPSAHASSCGWCRCCVCGGAYYVGVSIQLVTHIMPSAPSLCAPVVCTPTLVPPSTPPLRPWVVWVCRPLVCVSIQLLPAAASTAANAAAALLLPSRRLVGLPARFTTWGNLCCCPPPVHHSCLHSRPPVPSSLRQLVVWV